MNQTVIELNNVCKEFVSIRRESGFKGTVKGLFTKDKIRKIAVNDISFKIMKGEIVGYIGSNGAGKSTTIKIMTGILTPTKGQCLVNGIEPSLNRRKNAKNIGVVFGQRTQLWWDLPLTETFIVLKEIYEVSNQDFKERMDFLNDILGLDAFIHSSVRTLSLGQRMRADLAAALLHNPKILFLDEPTIGLDIVVKDKIRQAIREINKNYNTTIILTTHDLSDIEELCKRIIIIDNGKKIYDDMLSELKQCYGSTCRIVFELKEVPDNMIVERVRKELEGTAFDYYDNIVAIKFDFRDYSVAEVTSKIVSNLEIKDMKIEETELTDIIKRIYQNKM